MDERDTLPTAEEHATPPVLIRLAAGLPLAMRPYEAIGADLGLTEAEFIAQARSLRESRRIRRITGVFAGPTLGYRATLGALAVDEDRAEVAGEALQSLPCVTHIFELDDRYRLWFVVAVPTPAHLEAAEREIAARSGVGDVFRVLSSELRAVTGSFDADGAPDSNGPLVCPPATIQLSGDDRALVRLLQGDFPIVPRPFAEIAATLAQCGFHLDERWALERAQTLAAQRALVGLRAVEHRRLESWRLAAAVWTGEGETADSAEMVASFPETLHCFYRRLPDRRSAIVSIIEAPDRSSMDRAIERIRSATGLDLLRLQYPVREFKRAPMRYFTDGEW